MNRLKVILTVITAGLFAFATGAQAVDIKDKGNMVTLSNDLVSMTFDLGKGTYSVTDVATREIVLADARVMMGDGGTEMHISPTFKQENIVDSNGKGKRILIQLEGSNSPAGVFTFSLYDGKGQVVMGFGLRAPAGSSDRLMTVRPLCRAVVLPGKALASPQTLNGAAGAQATLVETGLTRSSPNSLLLTGLIDGKRRTIVWGGLAYRDFGKYAALRDGVIEMSAEDPVGRLVDAGETYAAHDTFYLDVTTADPFAGLEKYGRALREANHAHPNVYDFPVLCGWGVGALSHLGNVNNSAKLVGELELAQKCGLTKYTKVGIRLEPDTYCNKDHGNTEQGWWDDEHWAKYGHLVAPYETFAKWCAAIRQRDGIPYTYFQVGMPSDDYAKAFPGHMLSNDISRLALKHPHHKPNVTYDYTDPDFQKRVREVWARLRKDGIRGIKFDYPETGWRPEGGFEDKHSTTASAYRRAFQLCREGLGDDALLDERNLGESGRPCLDVTAGIVDTQRNWADSNKFVPRMVTIGGLRWYKNRTVFDYYPDSKTVHRVTPEIRQSMLTMIYLTSGRIDLATSFFLFTPEITHDFSRIYPAYREPFTARPLDAFTGIADPQVYDLELAPDWHQIALYNSGSVAGVVSVAISGDRVKNAIGLDAAASYYAYEFWSDSFLGKLSGKAKIERQLNPNCCAMISLRKVQDHPQVVSTNRHVLQGWVDLVDVKWDAAGKRLSGVAKVVGGEPFRIVIAGNGPKAAKATAGNAVAKLGAHPSQGLNVVTLARPDTGDVAWQVEYE